MSEQDNAPFFEMPNEVREMAHAKPYYGNQHVPAPRNHKAMEVNKDAIERSFLEGK